MAEDEQELHIDDASLAGLRRATAHVGWTVEQVVSLHGGATLLVSDGQVGRGHRRDTFLVQGGEGATVGDCLRVLGLALDRIAQRVGAEPGDA